MADNQKSFDLSEDMKNREESIRRMEEMYNKSIVVEKQCIFCKFGAGLFFSGYGVFHGARFYSLWKYYPIREKLFNIFATGFVFSLAFANFYAAYEIKMGKEMKLVELRPSYS